MKERGLSSIIGLGIMVVVLLIAASIFISSLRNYQGQTRTAEEERNDRIAKSVQTDIIIENAVYYENFDNIEIKAVNTGSTVLEVPSIQVFLDGKMVLDGNISSKLVEGTKTVVWTPRENLEVVVEDQLQKPERIKMVTDYGVSDYFTGVENR